MKAAIFDMDGLLIDSEPLWRQAEKLTFRRVGIELTDRMCMETLGLRPDEAVSYWYARFPWTGPGRTEIEQELLATVKDLISAHGRPLGGVPEVLLELRDAGLALGIASSSPPELIETVLGKLGLDDLFAVKSSAVEEARGKPDPAVYSSAARKLGVDPRVCIAFEDSIAGVQAASAAGMRVVAVPAGDQLHDPRFELADIRLRSLAEFSMDMLNGPRAPDVD